jgi:hypothetical protein
MPANKSDKETLLDSLLESLHYGEEKEDKAIVEQLYTIFSVPDRKKLRDHLIKAVDFSELFAELLRLAEPFTQMMNEIYGFLAAQKKTARSLEHLIVGENIQNKISFDLEAFPQLYQPVIQQIEGYLRVYSLDKLLNDNISPLALSESLLGCGHCTDPHYHKTVQCRECGIEMRRRFGKVFQSMEAMVRILPDEVKNQWPYASWCKYFETANKRFQTGTHWNDPCRGYVFWNQRLDEVEKRIDLVSEKRPGIYDVNVLVRFFELPFWKERNRLYEVWTLTHFIYLLRGVTFDLNIKDGQWHLMYGDAREPVAWVRGQNFEIEVWYQHKLKSGLKMFPNEPVEPEMLLVYHGQDGKTESLALIECKERKDYDLREIIKLSAFYRAQVGTALNIFCNYYDYLPPVTLQVSNDEPPVILCGQFQPGNKIVADVDREFIKLMNKRLGIFLQTVLIDISGSMGGKDIEGVYQTLNRHLAQLPGSKSLGGIFADQVELCDYDELVEKLRHPPHVGGGTQFNRALSQLRNELQKNNEDLAVINYYVITDVGFNLEDWAWLEQVDADASYNITLVAQRGWVSDDSRQRVEQLHRIKFLFL